MKSPNTLTAMAIAAHPDDIEFLMAGTLLLLRQAGGTTHYLTLANGSCGSVEHPPKRLRRIRLAEARRGAQILGAHFHPPLVDDMEILYELRTLRRLTSIIREVRPNILLLPSPQDYMEDHTNACRLAVSAAFVRGAPNFRVLPPRAAVHEPVTLYHAMPAGLRDPLRQLIQPGAFVNTTAVHALKRQALAQHESQKHWLDVQQGLDSYLVAMDEMSLTVGRMSRQFRHAEGWRRHSPWGFGGPDDDPLRAQLGDRYRVNRAYERELNQPHLRV
jgi:LmbE family N-acetylglucosaminyl deacetylase